MCRRAMPFRRRPQLTRPDWKSLNGVWQFAGASASERPPVGETLDERVLVPYPIESALSGIERHEDYMWYRRTVTVPASWKIGDGHRLKLELRGGGLPDEGLRQRGRGGDPETGGHDGFSADITDEVTRSGPQEVIVGVEDRGDQTWQPLGKQRNTPDRGIFFTGASGIWQSVWMEPVASGYVQKLDMTPDIDTNTLALKVETAGRDNGLTAVAVVKKGNKAVSTTTGPVGETLAVKVPNAELWSPDHPFLYDPKVTLKDRKTALESVKSYFGMREIGTARGADGKLRITLNHKITFLMSTLDQAYWPDGIYTAPTDQALAFDLKEHKRLGFNTIRKHIKVEPDR